MFDFLKKNKTPKRYRKNRKSLWRDAVELTEEYKQAYAKIEPKLQQEISQLPKCRGMCHRAWSIEKQLLAAEGIDWRTPAEMNPNVHFD